MDFILIFCLVLIGGAAIGAAITWAILKNSTKQALAAAQLVAGKEISDLREELATKKTTAQLLQQQTSTLQQQLAQERAHSKSESQIIRELTPVSKTLEELRSKISTLEDQRSKQHGELIGSLNQAAANESKMLETTAILAKALNSSSGRGSWGEVSLRKLLESSGMIAHTDYSEQTTLTSADATQRPDITIYLPGERVIFIDSKTPLSALTRVRAEANETELKQARAEHARALKKHIDELAKRNYSAAANSLDLVIAYLPNDNLLTQALQAEPSLLDYSYSKKVILTSPTSLFTVLKAIEQSWRHQAISKKAKEIYEISAELYKRLSTVAKHMTNVGKSLTSTVKSYNELIGSYERNLLPQAHKIINIDPKSLTPEIEKAAESTIEISPRQPVKPEFFTE